MELRKISQSQTKMVIGWDAVPGAEAGYRGRQVGAPKWTQTQSTQMTFAKDVEVEVEALGIVDSGEWPSLPGPAPGTPYDTLNSLSRVFGKWYTALGSGGQEPLSTSPPYTPWTSIAPNPSITEISTPHGAGLRFVCNDDMQASWEPASKLSYAAKDRDWAYEGKTEEWSFHFMLPASGNPQGIPNVWTVNGLWEIGHTSNASGHHLALDMQTGNVRCRLARQIAPGNNFQDYDWSYTPELALDAWVSVLVRCKWSRGSDGHFFCSVNGSTYHDSSGPTMWDVGGRPGVAQWGWYGTREKNNEIRFAAMQRAML